VQTRVRAELSTIASIGSELPDGKALETLPYFNGFLKVRQPHRTV
jgi:hypothetical protein